MTVKKNTYLYWNIQSIRFFFRLQSLHRISLTKNNYECSIIITLFLIFLNTRAIEKQQIIRFYHDFYFLVSKFIFHLFQSRKVLKFELDFNNLYFIFYIIKWKYDNVNNTFINKKEKLILFYLIAHINAWLVLLLFVLFFLVFNSKFF